MPQPLVAVVFAVAAGIRASQKAKKKDVKETSTFVSTTDKEKTRADMHKDK